MEKYNLVEDVSKLTNIPQNTLVKLSNKYTDSIVSAIKDCINNGETQVNLDLGYGILCICVDNDVVKYRFEPSNKLSYRVKDTINGNDEMIAMLEDSLRNKILSSYKEMY